MHEDFPADPVTLGIVVLALAAAAFGYVGFPGNNVLGALILLAFVAVPLLILEWIGFFVYDRFGRSGT